MAHALEADGKERNLYWRGPFAYFRKRVAGRDHWESMGELEREAARRLVREKRKAAALENYMDQWEVRKRRQDWSTVAEVCAAYDAYSMGVDINDRSVRENKSALRRVFQVGLGLTRAQADERRMNEFSSSLCRGYEARVMTERKEAATVEGWDEERRKAEFARAARTVGSTLAQAKSLFCRAALASPAYEKLKLPDLGEVLKLKLGASTIVRFQPPAQEVVDAILAAIPKFKESDRALWLALMLEINIGVRVNTGVHARWAWLQNRGLDMAGAERWMLEVRVAKRNDMDVRVEPALAREMMAVRAEGAEYIVPGKNSLERRAVFERACAWLRSQGMQDYRAPNHELRKWYLNRMTEEHDLGAATAAAGHSDPKLTAAVYTLRRGTKSVRLA